MKEFISGFGYTLDGFKLIFKSGIRMFVVIPLLINTVLFSLVIFFGAHEIINLSHWLSSTWHWAEWLVWIIWPLFVIVSITVVFYCFTLVANLIAAPFNGYLAEAVEYHLAGARPGGDSSLSALPREIIVSLKNELHKFGYFMVRALPLLVLFLIPMLNTVAPFVWMVFCSWLIALEYLDFPMSNHGIHFAQIRDKLKPHRDLCLGFGLAALLLTMIPFVNFLAMPVAVTGATKLWVEQLKPGHAVE